MNITLINIPFLYQSPDDTRHSQCLGLRYISSLLKQKGFQHVTFIDALRQGFSQTRRYHGGYTRGLTPAEITARVPRNTELIGISTPFSQTAPLARDVILSLKTLFPQTPIILGGVYPSTSPLHALAISNTDFILMGEGEHAFLQLAQGAPPLTVKGVYGRESLLQKFPSGAILPLALYANDANSIQDFCPAPVIPDLDSLPFPDYSIPAMPDYFTRGQRAKKTWENAATLITSRGCPFTCEFCSVHPISGRHWRGRSPENILDEMAFIMRTFQVTRFEIEDDNMTLNRNRALHLLEGIIRLRENGYPLEWRAPNGIRTDTADKTMIDLFKRSNCRQVNLALEHGAPQMLDIMNKKLSLAKARETISLFSHANLETLGIFIIVGYPGETDELFNTSISFLENLKNSGCRFSIFPTIAQPYPGTQLLEKCRQQGWLNENDLDDFFSGHSVWNSGNSALIRNPAITPAQIQNRLDRLRQFS